MWTPIRSKDDLNGALASRDGGQLETQYLELKSAAPSGEGKASTTEQANRHIKAERERHAKLELARDIVQFANSDGGTLVIGIDDGGQVRGVGGPRDVGSLLKRISSVLDTWTEPRPRVEMEVVEYDGRKVVSVNVWPSATLICVYKRSPDKSGPTPLEFPVRVRNSKRSMFPDQVVRSLADSDRASRLRLDELKARIGAQGHAEAEVYELHFRKPAAYGTIACDSLGRSGAERVWLGDLLPDVFVLRISRVHAKESMVHVPYAWLRTAWIPYDGATKISLDLLAFVWRDPNTHRVSVRPSP